MTRKEAAEKVAKLRKLAERAGTAAEGDAARKIANELTAQHGLTEVELSVGSRAAAFDDLMDELNRFVKKHDVPSAVLEVIEAVKAGTGKDDKAGALVNIVTVVRTTSMFFGFDKTVKQVKSVVDRVLKKHSVTV
jgi:hypothetical protein